MPTLVFRNLTPNSTGDVDRSARQVIPGVEPGGSRVGAPLKPALLIKDIKMTVLDLDAAAEDFNRITLYLKLSQSHNLNPGLHLPIGMAIMGEDATPARQTYLERELFEAQGTVWAPRVVGIHAVEQGTIGASAFEVRMSYERVDIPWMEWFIRWDFLDNVVDGEQEY